MESDDLILKEKDSMTDLYNVYFESKTLFIRAEELLSQMKLFPAPMLEHRDALEHIMRYFDIKNKYGLTENALDELDRALGHELRAFFDIADFICINIRQEINDGLSKVSTRKIKKVWTDYVDVKNKVVGISEEVAKIRLNRTSSVEHIQKYKNAVNDLFDIYKQFKTNIEPNIKFKF